MVELASITQSARLTLDLIACETAFVPPSSSVVGVSSLTMGEILQTADGTVATVRTTNFGIVGTTAGGTSEVLDDGERYTVLTAANSNYYEAYLTGLDGVLSQPVNSGKKYWEIAITSEFSRGHLIGLIDIDVWGGAITGYPANPFGAAGLYAICDSQASGLGRCVFNNGTRTGNGTYTFAAGDVIGVAVDFTLGRVWYSKNGTWFVGNPATNTSPTHTISTDGRYTGWVCAYNANSDGTSPPPQPPARRYTFTLRSGTAEVAYGPPAGFDLLG